MRETIYIRRRVNGVLKTVEITVQRKRARKLIERLVQKHKLTLATK